MSAVPEVPLRTARHDRAYGMTHKRFAIFLRQQFHTFGWDKRHSGAEAVVALLDEHHDILQLKPKMVFSSISHQRVIYPTVWCSEHCNLWCHSHRQFGRGKIVMGERLALAAPRTVFSSRVDSAAKSEARFDIYVWKESSESVCKVSLDRRLGAEQWYNITDVSVLPLTALTAGLTHFRQHWLDYP